MDITFLSLYVFVLLDKANGTENLQKRCLFSYNSLNFKESYLKFKDKSLNLKDFSRKKKPKMYFPSKWH